VGNTFDGRDLYGGCTGIHFPATGFFRLEKADRWWLVTPEGNAYLSFGLNHAQVGHLRRADNRSHWAEAFGISEDAPRQAFQPGFEKKLKEDMRAFGFTTLGTHSNTRGYSHLFANDVVNVRMVDICHYQTPTEADFRDMFSDDFLRHCDQRARDVCAPRRDDPNHLIFGDKFQGKRMGLPVPTKHIELFAKHFDLIFFQKYATWHDLEPLLDLFRKHGHGKPCYLGDGSINVAKERMPDPFGPRSANQMIRANRFREACIGSFTRRDLVGWDWCGWMALWVEDPDNLQARDPRHAGLQDPFGRYDQPFQQEMKSFADNLYDVALDGIEDRPSRRGNPVSREKRDA
jgi:hypothetical protein